MLPSNDQKAPSSSQELLNAVRQGTVPYGSPHSDVVSNTKELRKKRTANRADATNLLSAIQDTVIPPTA